MRNLTGPLGRVPPSSQFLPTPDAPVNPTIFELSTAHTLAVIRAVDPSGLWDQNPGSGVWSLRDQLRHIALVRESILRCLAGVATTGLGAVFETEAWRLGGTQALADAFERHAERCRDLLKELDPIQLDRSFTTPFGNQSTPRNYLRMMLLEETHHRAQMTLTLRLFGLTPPDYPGRAWAELGVDQP